jgi:DNA-binding NarL/FixJ family response regulator
MRTCVVILSGYALFAEGIVSRLRQYLGMAEFKIVDPRQPGAMGQIAAVQPSIVILDSTDADATQFCSLRRLLRSFPKLKIIYLDPEQDRAQVVTSEQCPATTVSDLVEVIGRSIGFEHV